MSPALRSVLQTPSEPIRCSGDELHNMLAEVARLHIQLAAVTARLLEELIARKGMTASQPAEVWLTADQATRIVALNMREGFKFWDADDGKEISEEIRIVPPFRKVTSFSFSPDSRHVVIRTFVGHSDEVWSCAFSDDGKHLISASDDRTLRLWDVQTGAEPHMLKGYAGELRACAFSPDGKLILVGDSSGRLLIFALQNIEIAHPIVLTQPTSDADVRPALLARLTRAWGRRRV